MNMRPEVTFIQFNLTRLKGAGAITFLGDLVSDVIIQSIGGGAANAADLNDLAGLDI